MCVRCHIEKELQEITFSVTLFQYDMVRQAAGRPIQLSAAQNFTLFGLDTISNAKFFFRFLVQLVVRRTFCQKVVGSIPGAGSFYCFMDREIKIGVGAAKILSKRFLNGCVENSCTPIFDGDISYTSI